MKKLIKIAVIIALIASCLEAKDEVVMGHTMYQKQKIRKQAICKGSSKQELTHSIDWVASWSTCAGDGAIKKDGTLWQLGKVGGCDWGQIIPIDPQTGKPEFKEKKVYHLNPKKIGNGFDGAKIINGGYRVYAIKKDGTLWGWGEEFREKPILLSQSHDWVNFEIKWQGNGCDAYDVGLKKDGTLWRFPESFDFTKKSPMGELKQIGKEKGWDKVVIGCSAMYALKKDGTLWIKHGYGYNFEKFDYNSKCDVGDKDFCKKLKTTFAQMPSQSFYNFESCNEKIINIDKKAGILCVRPEISYE